MKGMKFLIVCAFVVSFMNSPLVFAQQNAGGRGLMYVHSAQAIGISTEIIATTNRLKVEFTFVLSLG